MCELASSQARSRLRRSRRILARRSDRSSERFGAGLAPAPFFYFRKNCKRNLGNPIVITAQRIIELVVKGLISFNRRLEIIFLENHMVEYEPSISDSWRDYGSDPRASWNHKAFPRCAGK